MRKEKIVYTQVALERKSSVYELEVPSQEIRQPASSETLVVLVPKLLTVPTSQRPLWFVIVQEPVDPF